METTTPQRHATSFTPAENSAGNPAGAEPNETEQQLRRRVIQLMSELSLQLHHSELMDLADYIVSLSALARTALAK